MSEQAFAEFARAHGYDIGTIHADGHIHRFPGLGQKLPDKAGWCVLFPHFGILGDHRTGLRATWRPTDAVEAPLPRQRVEMRQAKLARMRDSRQRRERVAVLASELWVRTGSADPCHPYLARKGIKPYALHGRGHELLVPLCIEPGAIAQVQRIFSNGDKRFLSGPVSHMFYALGFHALHGDPDIAMLICEGMATAHSLHECTGLPVAAAMFADNLVPVAVSLRRRHPARTLVICADDDPHPNGTNRGMSAGLEAANRAGALFVLPAFPTLRKGDFNDMALDVGRAAVADAIFSVLEHRGQS